MKSLLTFFVLLCTALWIDLEPLPLDQLRTTDITVSIRGAVQNPGEVTVPMYSSVQDVLDQTALNENADLSTINPLTVLKDKDVITIPELPLEEEQSRILLNSADLEQLTTLPGIGPSTAQAILQYRDTNGYFQSIEDLMQVKGIGQAKFDKIKDRIGL